MIPTTVLLGQASTGAAWFVGAVGAKRTCRGGEQRRAVEVVTDLSTLITNRVSHPVEVSFRQAKDVDLVGEKTVERVLEGEEFIGGANSVDVDEIEAAEVCGFGGHGVAKDIVGAACYKIEVVLAVLGKCSSG